jgi:hypothetical protein
VWQRNDTDYTLTVATDPPQVVEPGEVIEHEHYVVGFTILDDEEAPAAPVDAPTPSKAARKGAAPDSAAEEATK